MMPDFVETRLSDFAETLIYYDDGKRVSFRRRPWMPQIMDSEFTRTRAVVDGRRYAPRWTLLKCGRQVEKSSMLSFKMLGASMCIPNICSLYVSSAGANTKEFADERIENTLRISPELRQWYGRGGLTDTKALKRFSNNSRIVLRSVYRENASRVRGIPSDIIGIDEIQDILPGALPVIWASANNSDLPMGHIRLHTGTPLTTDNIINQEWIKNSTQNMWLTRCPGCRYWNPPGLEQVGPLGMICEKCGHALNPLLGQWVRTGAADAPYEGYHLSQVVMPYTRIDSIEGFETRWRELHADIFSPTAIESKVRNEILGEAWDVGSKPITPEQLYAGCREWLPNRPLAPREIARDAHWPIFMGVDWGTGTDGSAYTVVTLSYAYDDGVTQHRPAVYFMKRYTGPEANPIFVKRDLADLFSSNRVSMCIADAGMGWDIIPELREELVKRGVPMKDALQKVRPMYYSGNVGQIIRWDDKSWKFTAARTRWMGKIFSLLKRQAVDLPRISEFKEPFGEDILNIHIEQRSITGEIIYSHVDTDDSFHSILYALTAKMMFYGELEEFANA